jgi:hypothetical protein
MRSREENELLTRVGHDTPMETTMRRYWIPALLAWELAEPDGFRAGQAAGCLTQGEVRRR